MTRAVLGALVAVMSCRSAEPSTQPGESEARADEARGRLLTRCKAGDTAACDAIGIGQDPPASAARASTPEPAPKTTGESADRDRGVLYSRGLSRILETASTEEWAKALEPTYGLGFMIGQREAKKDATSFFEMNEKAGCIAAMKLVLQSQGQYPSLTLPSVEECNQLVEEGLRGFHIPGPSFEKARLDTVKLAVGLGTSATRSLTHALEEGYAAGVLTFRSETPRMMMFREGFDAGCVGTLSRNGAKDLPATAQTALVAGCDAASARGLRPGAWPRVPWGRVTGDIVALNGRRGVRIAHCPP